MHVGAVPVKLAVFAASLCYCLRAERAPNVKKPQRVISILAADSVPIPIEIADINLVTPSATTEVIGGPVQLSLFAEPAMGADAADTAVCVYLRINGRLEVLDGLHRIIGLLELSEVEPKEKV